MDSLPDDMVYYIMGFCEYTLAFLVCRKWRNVYITKYKRIRFYLSAMLLKINTTRQQVGDNVVSDEHKTMMFTYACIYSPIEVIDYLMEKKFNVGNISRPRDMYTYLLSSLDLDKIEYYIPKIDKHIIPKLNITNVLKRNGVEVLKYLHSMGYEFRLKNIGIAAYCDSLESFKYMIEVTKTEINRKLVDITLDHSVRSLNSIRPLVYLLDDLKYTDETLEFRLKDSVECAVRNKNNKLVKYLYSKGISCDVVGQVSAVCCNIELLEWSIVNRIPINKEKAIEDIRKRTKQYQRQLLNITKGTKDPLSKYRLQEYPKYITDSDTCISILESLE